MAELYVENPLEFWCCNYGLSGADVVFLGVPFDGTSAFRTGSREAPNRIRQMSYSLETFSPLYGRDLKDLKMMDYGNVAVCPGNTDETLRRVKATVDGISGKFLAISGGEHIITLPVVQSLLRKHPKLQVLQFDAHLDLKDEVGGNRYTHATVMRRLSDVLGKKRIIQCGGRSFSPEEKDFADRNTVIKSPENLKAFEIKGPVYVTVDMDVFDPGFAPGVSTPEPRGLGPQEFFGLLDALSGRLEVVGFDVVEVCPPHDHSDSASLLAAGVMKEMLLAFRQ